MCVLHISPYYEIPYNTLYDSIPDFLLLLFVLLKAALHILALYATSRLQLQAWTMRKSQPGKNQTIG